VAAIAYTDLNTLMGKDRILSVQNVTAVIPFLGFLLGFGYIGHAVTIFEGHPSALAIGLQGADMLPFLQQDWADVADRVMRKPDIFVFGRDGQVRQLVHKPPS
jgi:hypothetical protein